MRIQKIHVAELRRPLPWPIRLGPNTIATRDYVAVRVELEDGSFGDALGYPRGTPLRQSVATLGRQMLGTELHRRRETLDAIEARNPTSLGTFSRALSLLDIACWDLAAKGAGLPLYRLLGGLRNSAPVTAVAGYYVDRRSVEDIVSEVALRHDEGHHRVKIMLNGSDASFDRRCVAAVTTRRSGQVAVDAHWVFRGLGEALLYLRSIDSVDIDFLEDPFPPHDVELSCMLSRQLKAPLAVGEDVVGATALRRLADHVGVLRVDATTCGGITAAIVAVHVAQASGCMVLPHVFAPLHVQLACALPGIESVEHIPASVGADPIDDLLREPVQVVDGRLRPSEEPGVGMALNWQAIREFAHEFLTVEASAGAAE